MSLIGVDVGTSAVKVAAYGDRGGLLASSRIPVHSTMPRPGWEETDPETVWQAAADGLASVAAEPALRQDPPQAMAISASGDEVFPLDERGEVVGPCILSGDSRGGELEITTATRFTAPEWFAHCGHVPERMDPINRILWWKTHRPEVYARASRFLGWHEFLTARLTGNAVTDRTLACKWLAYDLGSQSWSRELLADLSVEPALLPQIGAWGTLVGAITPWAAERTGLPPGLLVGVGSYDTVCAAVGAGAVEEGIAGLACGSWEAAVVPAMALPAPQPLLDGNMSAVPYPGNPPLAVLCQSPNGAQVVAWVTNLLNMSFSDLTAGLDSIGPRPSPVSAVPHLSGAISPWRGGRASRGALLGMTLATTPLEVAAAFLESTAYDLALAVELIKRAGVRLEVLRAAGGGAKNAWWMQLKADLSGVPVQVAGAEEAGALGAAVLAGMAAGTYRSFREVVGIVGHTAAVYEPHPQRKEYHAAKMSAYRKAVEVLLTLNERSADA